MVSLLLQSWSACSGDQQSLPTAKWLAYPSYPLSLMQVGTFVHAATCRGKHLIQGYGTGRYFLSLFPPGKRPEIPLQNYIFLETNDINHVYHYGIKSRYRVGCNNMDLLLYCNHLLLYASARRHLNTSLYETRHVHRYSHVRKCL